MTKYLAGLLALIIGAVVATAYVQDHHQSYSVPVLHAQPDEQHALLYPSLPIDTTRWTYGLGGGGWGHHELTYYTASARNSYVDSHGDIVLRAVRANGRWTSARLISKISYRYGTFTAKIKFQNEPGLWSALWLVGSGNKWKDHEVDIAEVFGNGKWIPAFTTVHVRNWSTRGSGSIEPVEGWHIWTVIWTPGSFTFYKDGHPYLRVTRSQLGSNWTYDDGTKMNIVLSLAVGGDGGGKVPSSFTSGEMDIAYVKVIPLNQGIMVTGNKVDRRAQL